MSLTLEDYRRIWNEKKILREVYTEYYKEIVKDLNTGKTLELGSGSGNFKQFKPDVIVSDIEVCQWADMCFDAHFMPFADETIGNIILIDVLHHLSNPVSFFKEAIRVLHKGGRIVIVEPFPSFCSLFVYKLFHPEPFLMNVDYFSKTEIEVKDPWEANQAISYLLFFKNKDKFIKFFQGNFRIVKRYRLSCILYPVSGGFTQKSLIPDFLIPLFKFLEFLLIPLRCLMAFRCYIVLEKV